VDSLRSMIRQARIHPLNLVESHNSASAFCVSHAVSSWKRTETFTTPPGAV